ncbi:MAG: hypothetical protein M1836_002258 [Candelina mexicana]|nr:MAG: hypothetical protein M1836_002258 [Candelina mexicana]
MGTRPSRNFVWNPEDPNGEWDIEKILSWRYALDGDGNIEYQVLWRGFPSEDNTWRTLKNLPPKTALLSNPIRAWATQIEILGQIGVAPKEHDPQADWRLSGSTIIEQDDVILEEEAEEEQDDGVEVVPETQKNHIPQGMPPGEAEDWNIGTIYESFLTLLGTSTSTAYLIPDVLKLHKAITTTD